MKTLKPVEEDDFTSGFLRRLLQQIKNLLRKDGFFDVIHSPNHHAEFISVFNSWQSGFSRLLLCNKFFSMKIPNQIQGDGLLADSFSVG